MTKGIAVVAPHPDDEIFGAGGALLKAAAGGTPAFWLIVTEMKAESGYTGEQMTARRREIRNLADELPFSDVKVLGFPAAGLDTIPEGSVIQAIKDALSAWQPETVVIPWKNDAHTDHEKVFNCAFAATKAFRAPSLRTVLAMEILSETNFSRGGGFTPNWYVDISDYLERKVELLGIFRSEMKRHPFPRSEDGVRALATLRGSEMNVAFAEAFHMVRHFQ